MPLATIAETLYRWWAYVTSGRTLSMILGIAFAVLAISLFAASRTKWGQSKPLTKCIALSVLAHVWLLMYAYGTRIVLPQGNPRGSNSGTIVALHQEPVDESVSMQEPDPTEKDPSESELPWEQSVPLEQLPKAAIDAPPLVERIQTIAPMVAKTTASPLPELPDEVFANDQPQASIAEAIPATPATSPTVPSIQQSTATSATVAAIATNSPTIAPSPPRTNVPDEYRLRQAPNRLQLAMPFGADADSEAAVESGLQWLARAQSPDGGWNAKQFGAGTETHALGEFRHGTGDRADTGVTGLALLAFLSAGHTTLDGKYSQTVSQGVDFLIRCQGGSGDLSGPKQIGQSPSATNARMYCHGIATLALAEAYVMTHDPRIKPALVKATEFTRGMQDRISGGWRYLPQEPGDLSQFGWQAMGLRSAERGGIAIPLDVKQRMHKFLDSCSAGQRGGLARYRPDGSPPSETMTAESLACRLIIGYPLTADAQREAEQMILSNLPGVKQDNVYYWYYATMALFQLQNEPWRRWNQALKKRLLETQLPAHDIQAGSWDPDELWGGYGGRVYSTAMSCLCLEVYYRYLPMYQANVANGYRPMMQR